MDPLNTDLDNRPLSSSPHLPPFEEINEDLPHEQSVEQRVASDVSQQLITSALEEQIGLKESKESHESKAHPFGDQPEDEHQNVEYQSEHRFSGHPIHQYIYDEEEEDEDEDEDDLHVAAQAIGKPLATDGHMFSSSDASRDVKDTHDLIGSEKTAHEEILYQLSDDNVLTAQSYGIGSDLRIGSHALDQPISDYQLNTEDPFSTPQKHKTDNRETEESFERYVDKCEPFETISSDFDMTPKEPKNSLLDFGSESQTTGSGNVPKDSNFMLEPMVETESKPNPSLSGDHFGHFEEEEYVMPSRVERTHTEQVLNDSHIGSANRSDTNNTFEPTLQPSAQKLDYSHDSPPIASTPEPVDTFEESLIDTIPKHIEPKVETIKPKVETTFKPQTMAKQDKSGDRTPAASATTSATSATCPFGPCVWFSANQINPTDMDTNSMTEKSDNRWYSVIAIKVAEFVYWKDPKKSGVVFGAGLAILLSLTVFSIISVFAYTSLAALSVTLSFRIYKNILQAVQKTNEGHPFKEYLEVEITPSSERIHQIVDNLLSHFNRTLNKLRSVFLVEDIIDSLKFVVLFWCLTYIGSWFNGLTLIILAYLGLFSLPKVYEMHKTQIDQYLNLAFTQINDITSKVRAVIPFPSKKEKDN